MARDRKNVFCVKIQPSDAADADCSVCSSDVPAWLQAYCALKAGEKAGDDQWHELFA